MRNSFGTNHNRYSRIRDDDLLRDLLKNMRDTKEVSDEPKVNIQDEPKLPADTEAEIDSKTDIIVQNAHKKSHLNYVEKGKIYYVGQPGKFHVMLEEYCESSLLLTNDIIKMFGQKVMILKIDDFSLCQVKFLSLELEKGFLPTSVLRNVTDFSRVQSPPVFSTKKERKNVPSQSVQISRLQNKSKNQVSELEKQNKLNKALEFKITNLEGVIKNLIDKSHEQTELLAQNRTHKEKLIEKLNQSTSASKDLKLEYKRMQREIEIYRTSFMSCDIKNFDRLIQTCSCIKDLTTAQRSLSDRISLIHGRQLKLATDTTTCKVCLSDSRTHVFSPCNHVVCCGACVKELRKRDPNYKCPICRTRVQSAKKAYFA